MWNASILTETVSRQILPGEPVGVFLGTSDDFHRAQCSAPDVRCENFKNSFPTDAGYDQVSGERLLNFFRRRTDHSGVCADTLTQRFKDMIDHVIKDDLGKTTTSKGMEAQKAVITAQVPQGEIGGATIQ